LALARRDVIMLSGALDVRISSAYNLRQHLHLRVGEVTTPGAG
jgi:hypothetical protein